MGRSFCMLAVQSAKKPLIEALNQQMRDLGFVPNQRAPEITFSLVKSGKWYVLIANTFDMPLIASKMPGAPEKPILKISCFDSDTLELQLRRDGKCEAVRFGHWDGDQDPDPQFWSALVPDFDAFSQILEHDFVYAEDALAPLGEILRFDGRALLNSEGIPFGFARAAKNLPPIRRGPVRFGYLRNSAPGNFGRGVVCGLSISNLGGPGKGIFIIAEGEILDRSDVSIHPVKLWSPCQRKSFPFEPLSAEFVPAEHEGRPVLRADFPDFDIPAGINADGLPSPMKIEFERCVICNFTVHGDRPVENLILRIVPMENPCGEFVFRQADCDFSSADMEEMQSGKISYNELVQRKRKQL